MHIELINTGSELMLGRVLNTHQQWLCRELADRGYLVSRQVAVPDTAAGIQQAMRESLSRADLVITTGGLGPTSDDLTREFVCKLLDRTLEQDTQVLEHITKFFETRKRRMPDSTRVQALVPKGAIVLHNKYGTAPGLAIEVSPNPYRASDKPTWVVMLPGPPRELRPMFTDAVVPLLQRVLPSAGVYVCRTLRTNGIGESVLEERVAPLLRDIVAAGLDLGYCARPGQVDVRLAASGDKGAAMVNRAEQLVRQELGDHIYTCGDEELEAVVIRLLIDRDETLALAESCTGGYITNRLTNVPGASAVLMAGLVTYSNKAKQRFLRVRAGTLAEYGAVSEPTAREMAEKVRARMKASYGISVTGIAGPSGGSPAKPVGTVFIGLATWEGVSVTRNSNPFDRETFKQVTAQQAMDILRREILRGAGTEKNPRQTAG